MKVPIDMFENWLVNKNLKKRTIDEYLYYFNKFNQFSFFNQESVSRFLSGKENRNGVARSFLLNFKKFLMINYKELGFDKDVRMEISEVELPTLSGRTKQRLVKPLTEDQVLSIEKHLTDEKEKLELLLSYYGGLRIGELMKIQVSSFNWDSWKKDMTKWGECRVYGKGDKERIALFPPDLMKRTAIYIRSRNFPSVSSYIFMVGVESLAGINMKNKLKSWWKKLRKASISAGIIQFGPDGKVIPETNVHPHTLRHSWGYYLRNVKNMDIRDIQDVLGHSSIQSTQRYTYTDKERLKEKLL